MVHTAPDYSTKYKLAAVFGQIDTSELAARLKSINTYDRRGTIIALEDFEDNLNRWDKIAGGAGSAAVISTDWARNGASSLKLTTANGVPTLIHMGRSLQKPPTGRIGVEASCFFDADVLSVIISIALESAGTRRSATFAFDQEFSRFSYRNSLGPYTPLETAYTYINDLQMVYTGKIVGDFSTGKYVRAMFGGNKYDISDQDMLAVAAVGNNELYVDIVAHGDGDGTYTAYIDDFIITQDEP